jgi:hypothetical protein
MDDQKRIMYWYYLAFKETEPSLRDKNTLTKVQARLISEHDRNNELDEYFKK